MKKLLSTLILTLLFPTFVYAGLFQKFKENGITLEEYKKRCKKVHFFSKSNWPQLISEENNVKMFNCMTGDLYGEYQIFKDDVLVQTKVFRPNKELFSQSELNAFIIGLSLMSGNTPSISINNTTTLKTNESGVNMTGGMFVREMVSGSNRICFYKTLSGEVAITVKASQRCKQSLNN
jgi:hypothetical protein